jgi:hypothetical protein
LFLGFPAFLLSETFLPISAPPGRLRRPTCQSNPWLQTPSPPASQIGVVSTRFYLRGIKKPNIDLVSGCPTAPPWPCPYHAAAPAPCARNAAPLSALGHTLAVGLHRATRPAHHGAPRPRRTHKKEKTGESESLPRYQYSPRGENLKN